MKIRISNILKATIIIGLIFVLGCSNSSEDKKLIIGFSQTGINDEWRKSMNQAMKIQAAFYSDIELKILEGQDDINDQIKDIEALIADNVDVLIVSPVQAAPITPIVERAFKKGIPEFNQGLI